MNDLSNLAVRAPSVVFRRPSLRLPQVYLIACAMAADFLSIGLFIHAVDFLYHGLALDVWRANPHTFVLAWLCAVLFIAFQGLSGTYAVRKYIEPTSGWRNTLLSWLMVAFVIAWIGFLLKTTGEYSRGALTATFAVGAGVVVLVRLGVANLLRAGLGQGAIAVRGAHVICLGKDSAPVEIFSEAQKSGVEIVGVSVLQSADMAERGFPQTCADLASELRDVFREAPFDEIYVFFPWKKRGPLQELANALGRLPLPVFLFADAEMARLLQTPARSFGRFKGFEVQRPPLSWLERALKRVLDVSVALAGIVLLAPLFIAVSLAIRATSGSPVIFRQERQGFCGKRFKIYKFRTMSVCEDGPSIAQATVNDPRVTPLGAVLRRTSIDELPQLFNVLMGDMSIVGPRPHAVAHDEYYSDVIAFYARRQNVKPGLTGWAQLQGYRGETKDINAMLDRINLDIWYINNWSIWKDVQIIFRTAIRILNDKRAY